MKQYEYTPHGVCSRQINITLDDSGKIAALKFLGGCHGNLQGISALAVGQSPEELVNRLEGIDCRGKGTSCPDQLAQALKQIIQES